jgi:hypothetical protein
MICCLQNSIERRSGALQSQPEVGAVYSDVILIDHTGKDIDLFSRIYPVPKPSGFIFPELAIHNIMVLSSVMFRRPPDQEILLFDEDLEFSEDTDFWLRMSVRYPFQYINEPLVRYRVHSSANFTTEQWGLPGESSIAHHQEAKEAELKVQRRAFSMPAFMDLSPRQRAKIYCSHGVKLAMIGNLRKARKVFKKAIQEAPSDPPSYALLLLSYLGQWGFERIILWRRGLTRRITRMSKSATK